MSRLTPLPWHRLVCVFEQLGYRRAGQKGSHVKMEKPGVARPLIVPKYDEVGRDIITTLNTHSWDYPRCILDPVGQLLVGFLRLYRIMPMKNPPHPGTQYSNRVS
jgi:predicted RNA binding protein YcfA (HicA-like mRNA interferase family)